LVDDRFSMDESNFIEITDADITIIDNMVNSKAGSNHVGVADSFGARSFVDQSITSLTDTTIYDDRIATAMAKLGYNQCKEGQREIINAAISNRDVMAVLPTGGGKTLCFVATTVIVAGVTIVFCPIVSLIESLLTEMKRLGIPALRCPYISDPCYDQIIQSISDPRSDCKIIFCTPEHGVSSAMGTILSRLYNQGRINLFVVDECHCMR